MNHTQDMFVRRFLCSSEGPYYTVLVQDIHRFLYVSILW